MKTRGKFEHIFRERDILQNQLNVLILEFKNRHESIHDITIASKEESVELELQVKHDGLIWDNHIPLFS